MRKFAACLAGRSTQLLGGTVNRLATSAVLAAVVSAAFWVFLSVLVAPEARLHGRVIEQVKTNIAPIGEATYDTRSLCASVSALEEELRGARMRACSDATQCVEVGNGRAVVSVLFREEAESKVAQADRMRHLGSCPSIDEVALIDLRRMGADGEGRGQLSDHLACENALCARKLEWIPSPDLPDFVHSRGH
jgi:hypothetical protein